MDAVITARDLHYSYESAADESVRGVTFDAQKGEFLAVLGRNASGKSTLAKLMNGLCRPTSGEISVCGIPLSDDESAYEIRKRCGMVFQNPDNQLVTTVVEEDVAFGPENLGLPTAEIRRRVDEALRAVGMSRFSKSAPHWLSGGQKQRVAIAGVLAMEPPVIVFDEATAMLDPIGREEVLKVVRSLNREKGITVIWITHFMDEAALADRILIMSEGRIALEGAPKTVLTDMPALAKLGLEAPEMTQLAAELQKRGLSLPGDILTVDEMEDALCRLKF